MDIVFTGGDFYRVGGIRTGKKVVECVLAKGAIKIWDSPTPGLLRVVLDCGNDSYTVTVCDSVSIDTPENGRTSLSMWRDGRYVGAIMGQYGH